MKALVFDGNLRYVEDAPRPKREGEALIHVIRAGICNTDLEIARGYAGFHGILGHEFVGRVIESPEPWQVGQRVVGEINAGCGACSLCLSGDSRHCATRTVLGIKERDGAFADMLSLPSRNLIEVPDSVTDEAAVFAEPLAAAMNIIEQVDIQLSTKVAVIGDGKLAQLIILVLAQKGCALTVIGKHEEKLELAGRSGARCFRIKNASDLEAIDGWLEASKLKNEFDLVIEASGSESGLPMAINLTRPCGVVILKSTHHKFTSLDTSPVVVNEITIKGSRCGRLRPAIDLLATGAIDTDRLISHEFPLEESLKAFEKAAEPTSMKVFLRVS